jgi:beta-galactosidase/beta-glucuronidase
MGFNGVRIHQKIEDPKFLYWCDKLGLVVWAEMPSFHLPSERNHAPFIKQWREVITRDFNHPCIIVWVPFNEQWGIQDVWLRGKRRAFFEKVIKATRAMDNTRLLVDNSGWEHLDSDILDIHTYAWNEKALKNLLELLTTPTEMRFSIRKAFFLGGKKSWPLFTKPLLAPSVQYQEQPIIVSEYGGFGYYPTQKGSLLDNFRAYTLAIANAPHIAGFCYTQQYDTEQEKNGLLTYDRKPKVNPAEIKAINDEVIKITSHPRERDSNVLPLRR